ncbi:hypothetical protein M405DRAFT_834121 [Rhizopogon salebrosus TDB-379]|nr:hypothetical protein M405DRAFT_834121 [Rhizopogon salebrosus TDB-379]
MTVCPLIVLQTPDYGYIMFVPPLRHSDEKACESSRGCGSRYRGLCMTWLIIKLSTSSYGILPHSYCPDYYIFKRTCSDYLFYLYQCPHC